MTYFRFHLYFNGPVLVALLAWPAARDWHGGRIVAAGLVLLAVYIFTTPWDNVAVGRGIWDFAEGRHMARLWHLPVEEYLFFGIQSLEVMLLVNGLLSLGWGSATWPMPELGSAPVLGALGALGLIWVVAGFAGRKRARRFNYAWHLFFWFLPVIAAQWIIGWGILMPRWPLWVTPTIILGGWLSTADVKAAQSGLWYFDGRQVTGLRLREVLPWEEVAFFHLTSLLVAQSYLLLLPEAAR